MRSSIIQDLTSSSSTQRRESAPSCLHEVMVLRISAERLNEVARKRFEERLIKLILQHEPVGAQDIDTAEGRGEVRRQCQRAKGYGLASESDLARYVVTAWLMGPDFDRDQGAMREVLTSNSLTPTQKADGIGRIAVAVLRTLDDEG